MDERVESLTSRQRECLRGKWDRKLDKSIAAELNISTRAVEEHLRAAREKLGVGSTREAVERVAAALSWADTVSPNRGSTELPAPAIPTYETPEPAGSSAPISAVRDIGWTLDTSTQTHLGLPLRKRGERSNDLSINARHLWIFILTVGIPAAIMFVLAASDTIARIVGDLARIVS